VGSVSNVKNSASNARDFCRHVRAERDEILGPGEAGRRQLGRTDHPKRVPGGSCGPGRRRLGVRALGSDLGLVAAVRAVPRSWTVLAETA
jgi:hypothetical protein